MVGALYLVFLYVPTEQSMGVVQRIFYFHVPAAWAALLAYVVVFIASIIYLVGRQSKWDIIAHSSAQVGLVFTTLFLITGSIWAKPIWGVWWTWDARLTTALILWFIYVAYLMVRSYATEEQRGARFAAVVGIVGFLDIPIIALANTLWRVQHPGPVIFEGGLAPPMFLTLMVCVATFSALYVLLLRLQVSVKRDENEIKQIEEAIWSNTSGGR